MANKVPEIRFAGFDGEWQSQRFPDVVQRVGQLKYDESLPCVEFEDINAKRGTLNKNIFEKDVHKPGLEFETNDILYGKLRPYLGNVLLSNFHGLAVGDFWIFRTSQISPAFLYHFVLGPQFGEVANISQGSKMPRASWDNIKRSIFSLPSDEESEVIGCYLSKIDEIITKQERLIAEYYKSKQVFIDYLFPQDGETQPRIRLNGFSGDWIKKSLSEFAYRITRKNRNLESDNVMTISALYGLISQSEFYNKRIASLNLTGYYLMQNGEFAYNKSYSSDYPWGAVKRLDKYNEGVVSNLYIIFGVENIESDFVVCYFMSNLWHKAVSLCAKEGARNHGLLNISAEDFLNIPILIPSSMDEQKVIANLLMEYDRLIQLNEQKLEKLRNLKQAMLDKMFV